MTINITAEQIEQVQELILDRLNKHHQNRVPFREVWAKPAIDMDDFLFLDIWVIYDGDPQGLDPGMLNSFEPQISDELRKLGIEAKPSTSYVPASEADQLGEPWTR